jgi:hypothetical protein
MLSATAGRDSTQEDDVAYFGIYRGIVMNTADPLMSGRVQVNVPAINNIGADCALPCRQNPALPMPPIGTQVWVMFEAGDVNYPVWMGRNA